MAHVELGKSGQKFGVVCEGRLIKLTYRKYRDRRGKVRHTLAGPVKPLQSKRGVA